MTEDTRIGLRLAAEIRNAVKEARNDLRADVADARENLLAEAADLRNEVGDAVENLLQEVGVGRLARLNRDEQGVDGDDVRATDSDGFDDGSLF